MATRKKTRMGRARTALSSIYKRMAAVGSAGMARMKKMRNRTGYDHLAQDEADFAYIEKEANDILAAIARLRARDAGEYPPEEYFYGPSAPSEAAEFYEPAHEAQMAHEEPVMEPVYMEGMEPSNMTMGRRRNRAGSNGVWVIQLYEWRYPETTAPWGSYERIPGGKKYKTESQAIFAARKMGLDRKNVDWRVAKVPS